MWRFFSSVKLALFLLIFLALTSIVGTVIPQQEEALEFSRRLSPGVFRLFSSLGLFDMYHSSWFRIIIALLSLNLIVCSLDRLPGTLKLLRARPKPDRLKPFENLPADRTFLTTGDIRDISRRTSEILSQDYRKLEEKGTDEGQFFYADKGRFSYFGVYVIHLSVLIILLGAILGSLLGLEAYVTIPEGETVGKISLRKGGAFKDLGFGVRCERFVVEFYENGAPKEFRSDLKFLVNDKPVLEGSLLVNHPITFNGITFYQSSYGPAPGGTVRLKIARGGAIPDNKTLEVKVQESISLPGGEGEFQVLDVDTNFRGALGPAALISIKPKEGQEMKFWIFQQMEKLLKRFPEAMFRAPTMNPSSFQPYTFTLENLRPRYFTGLQVNRDPGVPLVWIGCFLMVAGFLIAFFTSHRAIMVRISKEKKKIRVSIAGKASKNPVGAENELNKLMDRIRQNMMGQVR